MPEKNPIAASGKAPEAGRKRRPWWVRVLKWLGISAAVIVAMVLVVVTLVVWILSPTKLTPLVERHASEYLNADLRAQRIELTFWHTFPHLTLDVDSLRLTSRSLRGLPDSIAATLPSDADSLLTLGRFHGEIDLLPLLAGRIALRDVELHRPAVNLVQVSDSVANYLIMPPPGGGSYSRHHGPCAPADFNPPLPDRGGGTDSLPLAGRLALYQPYTQQSRPHGQRRAALLAKSGQQRGQSDARRVQLRRRGLRRQRQH